MPTKTSSTSQKKYIYAVGRRKTASARIRLYQKKGDLIVNDQAIVQYFPGQIATAKYLLPLKSTGTFDRFSFSAKVSGGGKQAQLEAVVHGIARALSRLDHDQYHQTLKKLGLLTRDPRMRQSRSVGTGGKARRQKQSPKR